MKWPVNSSNNIHSVGTSLSRSYTNHTCLQQRRIASAPPPPPPHKNNFQKGRRNKNTKSKSCRVLQKSTPSGIRSRYVRSFVCSYATNDMRQDNMTTVTLPLLLLHYHDDEMFRFGWYTVVVVVVVVSRSTDVCERVRVRATSRVSASVSEPLSWLGCAFCWLIFWFVGFR